MDPRLSSVQSLKLSCIYYQYHIPNGYTTQAYVKGDMAAISVNGTAHTTPCLKKSSTSYFAEYFRAGLTNCKNFNSYRVRDNQ